MSGSPRILIIRLSSLGDVVITTPVSRAIKEAMPDAYVAWVVEPPARGVLEGNPFLDDLFVWDRRRGSLSLGSILQVRRELTPKRFDYALDCQGNLRSGLVARLSGARTIVGNRGAKEGADRFYHVRVPRSETDPSSRQRCLDLLRPLGIESSDRRMVIGVGEADRSASREALAAAGVAADQPYACLAPATTWKQKHWFEERWSALAGLLRERLGLVPVLLGGKADREMTERIREAAEAPVVNLAGATSLKASAAVLAGARLAVTVDTFLMHASVAMETPTVALCGASWWPGFQDYPKFTLLREEMACSPCLRRPTCGGRFDCMRALDAERVFRAAADLLRNDAPLPIR